MTTPHEWFDSPEYGPHLHNRHAAEPYFDDPDYWGHHHGPALPAISTIGRGPRGRGLYIANLRDSDGQLSFDIMEEGTNEVVYSVPNIAGDVITNIRIEHDNVQPGDVTPHDITVKRGGEERTYTVGLPSGAPGSTMFLAGEFARTSDDTYHTTVGNITLYGKPIYRHRPWPRPNDTIACTIREQDGSHYLAIGTIENVGGNQNNKTEHNPLDNVVFTCRTFAKIPDVSISSRGTWIVGGTDTGVLAKGEKGDKGDRGERGPRGLTGATGLKGDKGDTGDKGAKGDPGANGRNGRDGKDGKGFELGEVTTSSAAYGQPASATFTLVEGTENTYDLDLVIPEGKPGEELKWQPGIWPYDQLPSWTDTPVNTIFVVRDTDRYLDLYIRGQLPVEAELGGPWVVVENILQYPINYKELEGSPIVWNETTQKWEFGNGFEIDDNSGIGANCSTAADNQVKVVDTFQKLVKNKPIEIEEGTVIVVWFNYGNSATSFYLNVDGSGPKQVYVNHAPAGTSNPLLWTPGVELQFMYMGNAWHYIGEPGSYVCNSTSAPTEAYKVASWMAPIVIRFGTRLTVMSPPNTYDEGTLYLRFNDIDTSKIYRDGNPTSPDNTILWDKRTIVDLVRVADHWEFIGEPGLADVAMSGDYGDLENAPFVGENIQKSLGSASLTTFPATPVAIPSDMAITVANMLFDEYSASFDKVFIGSDGEIAGMTMVAERSNGSEWQPLQELSASLEHTVEYQSGTPVHKFTFHISDIGLGKDICDIIITRENDSSATGFIGQYDQYATYATDRAIRVSFTVPSVKFTSDYDLEIWDNVSNKPDIPEIVVVSGSKECARVNDASGDYNFLIDIPEDLNPYDYAVISVMQQVGGWVTADQDAWTDAMRETSAGDATPNICWMYNETTSKWQVQLNIYNNTANAVTLKYRVVFMKVG